MKYSRIHWKTLKKNKKFVVKWQFCHVDLGLKIRKGLGYCHMEVTYLSLCMYKHLSFRLLYSINFPWKVGTFFKMKMIGRNTRVEVIFLALTTSFNHPSRTDDMKGIWWRSGSGISKTEEQNGIFCLWAVTFISQRATTTQVYVLREGFTMRLLLWRHIDRGLNPPSFFWRTRGSISQWNYIKARYFHANMAKLCAPDRVWDRMSTLYCCFCPKEGY